MQDYQKLNIYNKAIEYCTKIYKFSTKMPSDEKYGLISQIKRASISIPLNISEGCGCKTNKEIAKFISYAYRSANEVLTCLELSIKLKIIKDIKEIENLKNEGIELSKMIYSFSKKLDILN
ncbi:MAG: four helix bundle protein [Candidatus Firestonebacteria bacterium]|nr:four helix bundle protein [Candidatus Firestonebacteria bacterium]